MDFKREGGGGGAGSAFDVFRAETCIAFLDFFLMYIQRNTYI